MKKQKFEREIYFDWKDYILDLIQQIEYNDTHKIENISANGSDLIKLLYFYVATKLSNNISKEEWEDMEDFLEEDYKN